MAGRNSDVSCNSEQNPAIRVRNTIQTAPQGLESLYFQALSILILLQLKREADGGWCS